MDSITTKHAIELLQAKTVKQINYATDLGLVTISSIEFTDGTVISPYGEEAGDVKIDSLVCNSEEFRIIPSIVCHECSWHGTNEDLIQYERIDGDGFYMGCPVCGEPKWNLKSE